METFKISLSKPIQMQQGLCIGDMIEENGILTITLNSGDTKPYKVNDPISFVRTLVDETNCCYETTKVVEIVDDVTLKVEAPSYSKGLFVSMDGIKSLDDVDYYGIVLTAKHSIFAADIEESVKLGVPYTITVCGETNFVFDDLHVSDTNGEVAIEDDFYNYPTPISNNRLFCKSNIFEVEKKLVYSSEVYANHNPYYFKGDDGKCVIWENSAFTITIGKDTSYWHVPVSLSANEDYVHLYQEENLNTHYVNEIKASVIPPFINMEKVKYSPVIKNGKEYDIVSSITFNLHFRKRNEDGWYVPNEPLPEDFDVWNTIKNYEDIDISKKDNTVAESDAIKYLGFTDSDIQFQKMKVKKSFLRLSFYTSKDPLTQSLLYYSTVFLDSGELYGRFIKKRNEIVESGYTWDAVEEPSYVLDFSGTTNKITSQIIIYNEYNTTKSSEGFNLYLFAEDAPFVDENNSGRTIYMKVEFNHAGYGRTLPFLAWPLKNEKPVKLTMDNYFDSLYIPIEIMYINNKHYYRVLLDNKQCFTQGVNTLEFNLFEPRLETVD